MSRISSSAFVATFVLAGLVSACSSSGSAESHADLESTVPSPPATSNPTPPPSSTSLALPTVTEAFTVLSCPAHSPQTTLEIEGCAEHEIVRLDRRINGLAQAVYVAMPDPHRRADFAAAQQAWITYRHAACVSEADADAGGTLAAVTFGQCEVRIDRQRSRALAAMRRQSG